MDQELMNGNNAFEIGSGEIVETVNQVVTPEVETTPTETTPVEITPVETAAPALMVVNLDDLVKAGRKGITNAQMIPALKKALAMENSQVALGILYAAKPEVFTSSAKYLPDSQKLVLKNFVEDKTGETFELKVGKKASASKGE